MHDERSRVGNPSIRGALPNLPQSNPQIYPQAVRISRLAFPRTPHYLVSPSKQTPTYWVFAQIRHKHICPILVHTHDLKRCRLRRQPDDSAPSISSKPRYRQQSDGDLITVRPSGDGTTTSSGASLIASTRLTEPGRRRVVPFLSSLQVPAAQLTLFVWRCRYGMNGSTAQHSTA